MFKFLLKDSKILKLHKHPFSIVVYFEYQVVILCFIKFKFAFNFFHLRNISRKFRLKSWFILFQII